MSADPISSRSRAIRRACSTPSAAAPASITAVAESACTRATRWPAPARRKGCWSSRGAVSRGASTSATDKKGRTPADVAQAAGHGQLAAALRQQVAAAPLPSPGTPSPAAAPSAAARGAVRRRGRLYGHRGPIRQPRRPAAAARCAAACAAVDGGRGAAAAAIAAQTAQFYGEASRAPPPQYAPQYAQSAPAMPINPAASPSAAAVLPPPVAWLLPRHVLQLLPRRRGRPRRSRRRRSRPPVVAAPSQPAMSFGGSPQPAKPAAANPVETVLREQGAKLVESQMVAVVPRAAVDKAVAGEKAAALGELCNSTATKIEVHHVDAASLSYVTIGGGTGGAAGQILFDFLHEVTDGEACGVAIRPAAAQLPKLGEATLAEVRTASGARVALQSPLLAIAGALCARRRPLLLRDAIPAAPAADDPATRPAASSTCTTCLRACACRPQGCRRRAAGGGAAPRLLVPPPPAATAPPPPMRRVPPFLSFDSVARGGGAALLRRACDGQQAPYARRLSLGGRLTGRRHLAARPTLRCRWSRRTSPPEASTYRSTRPQTSPPSSRARPPLGDADAALLRAACLARLREQAATAGAVGPTALRSVEVALLAVESLPLPRAPPRRRRPPPPPLTRLGGERKKRGAGGGDRKRARPLWAARRQRCRRGWTRRRWRRTRRAAARRCGGGGQQLVVGRLVERQRARVGARKRKEKER